MRDAWIIWFEDPDRDFIIFSGEGAEQAAHRTYKKMLGSWSCHLFRKIELIPELSGE